MHEEIDDEDDDEENDYDDEIGDVTITLENLKSPIKELDEFQTLKQVLLNIRSQNPFLLNIVNSLPQDKIRDINEILMSERVLINN